MYRVMFIDDEPWALKGITDIIDWHKMGFHTVGSYSDPFKAIENYQLDLPDVVFVDIRMPKITGFEFIEWCKNEGHSPIFVIVSAYAEFEYAKKALEQRAAFYVLKPLDKKNIEDIASQVKKRLDNFNMVQARKAIQEYMLNALYFGGRSGVENIEEYMPELIGTYSICIYKNGNITADEKPMGNIRQFKVLHDYVLTIASSAVDPRLYANKPCGISLPGSTIKELPKKIKEAFIAMQTLQFYKAQNKYLIYRKYDEEKIKTASRNICNAIKDLDYKKAHSILKQVEDSSEIIQIDELIVFYNSLVRNLNDILPDFGAKEDFREFTDCFEMVNEMQDKQTMYENIKVLFDSFYEDTQENSIQDSFSISQIIQYVDEFYTTSISLEQLSRKFYISFFYLCRQFKKVTGMTYTEYVTQKRIEKACKLLKSTSLSIADVGVQSGYNDYYYFSRVFKKMTGLTPTHYRKSENHHIDKED